MGYNPDLVPDDYQEFAVGALPVDLTDPAVTGKGVRAISVEPVTGTAGTLTCKMSGAGNPSRVLTTPAPGAGAVIPGAFTELTSATGLTAIRVGFGAG